MPFTAPTRTKFLARFGLHRPELRAWALYDWANSAFVLIIVTAVFPIYYSNVPAGDLPAETGAAYFAWATTIVLAIVAVIAPLLGAAADFLGWRKRLLGAAILTGVIPTGCLVFISHGEWLSGLLFFGIGNLGLATSFVLYDSLLPHIASDDEMDRVSTGGYALGYLGSGLLLILNLLWIQFPESWGFSDAGSATRFSFLSVACWWLVFSLPVLRVVKEPPRRVEQGEGGASGAVRTAFGRLGRTLREIRAEHRQAFLLLVAILVYTDGIGTIIRMAAIYAKTRGLPDADVILAILLVQFVGIPFSILFGNVAGRFGTKKTILAGLIMYGLATVVAWQMETVIEFYVLAMMIAVVQGGTQGLSRSFFASMVPKHRSSEFFGFFSVAEKVAGIFGPLVFALLISITGSSQTAVLSVALFFLLGGLLLIRVNEEEGLRERRSAEAKAVNPV